MAWIDKWDGGRADPEGSPDVQVDRELVDAVTARMVLRPGTLDILLEHLGEAGAASRVMSAIEAVTGAGT